MVEIVNVVGSGDLGVELNLEALSSDIEVADYDPDEHPELFIRFQENSPLIIVYRTGKYIIRGGESHELLFKARDKFLDLLSELDIISPDADHSFEVKNVVCLGDLERTVNLNKLILVLGIESIEYEPEQFPGLVYRPEEFDVTMLVFGSGKVVITGSNQVETAEAALESLESKITSEGVQ